MEQGIREKQNEESGALLLTGTFLANARGFGFVEVPGQEEDFFIPEDKTGGAFHKDIVRIEPLERKDGRRREARVAAVVSRGITRLVGTYQESGGHFGFVVPDDRKIAKDVFVPAERSKGAVEGHKVVAELTSYGAESKNPEGKIVEILGHKNDPGVDVLALLKGYEIPVEFGEKVLNQAGRVSKPVSDADRAGRRDLRDMMMVTIDGDDAKDLDDAVSLTAQGDYYHLGVHIADVANYVQENSALDREALKRGTSVYLADRVIPMLPHVLSNGICSLNAGEDRLALSCLMTIDKSGEIVDYEICESVICVNKRLTYTVVKELLDFQKTQESEPESESPAGLPKEYCQYEALLPMLLKMREVSRLLRAGRRERGAVDFDFPECKIRLDGRGRPVEIRPYERNEATDIIEDFMLAANETVAQHFYWLEIPFVYRVHDVPEPEKIRKLSAFINNFGYYMKTIGRAKSRVSNQEIHPRELQKLLDRIAGTPEEALISRLALRSMRQAKYSTESTGHFGLASRFYCHFTSPIRRYPDLQIHRIIKEQLRGRLTEERMAHYASILPEVCMQCSVTERRADEVQREADKMKKAQYMEERLGECFEGVISGIMSWGIFVELPNTIEGMIPAAKLPDDHYSYYEKEYEMRGETFGRTFKLGMPIRVRVAAADSVLRSVEFALEEE